MNLQELMSYVNLIKTILDRNYGKGVVFYNDGVWYSREHSRNLTLDELSEYLLQVVEPLWCEDAEEGL